MNKLCTGCKHLRGMCVIKHESFLVVRCPCIRCLVKPMCRTICKIRHVVYSHLPEDVKMNLDNLDTNYRISKRKKTQLVEYEGYKRTL
jgi:hypothetical protein